MITNFSSYKRTVLFYALSTIIPWSFWLLAAYISHLEPEKAYQGLAISALGLAGLISPMLIALGMIYPDRVLRADVQKRLFSLKGVSPFYLLLACFFMLGSILAAQAISLLFGYSASQFAITGSFTFTSGVFPVWFLLILAPVVEELAWHSYGTDSLRSRFSLFATSILFAVFWGIWHLPLAFIKGYYQSMLVESGWIHALNFPISLFPYVLIMNWLYYKTGRNIAVTILFHITAGYFNEIFATHPDSKVIQTAILLVFITIVILRDRDFFFATSHKLESLS